MEWLLVEVVPALLFLDRSFDLSETGLRKRLVSRNWQRLNDAYVIELIETYFGLGQNVDIEKTISDLNDAKLAKPLRDIQTKARALLARKPPRLIAGLERFQPRLKHHDANLHRLTVKMARDFVVKWATDFNIDAGRWHVWHRKIRLTKLGAYVPMSIINDAGERNEEHTESARIVIDEGAESVPINNLPQALTSLLADYDYRIMRIFVLFDADIEELELRPLREKIFEQISRDMQDAGWTYPRRVEGTEDAKFERFRNVHAGEGDDEDESYHAITESGIVTSETEDKADIATNPAE